MNGVPDTRTSPMFPLAAIALLILAPVRLLQAASPEAAGAFAPPRHCAPPGKGHAVTNRAFTGIPSVAVAPQGRLWATWYAGVTPGEDLNNYAVLATSGDGGATWREVLVVDPDARGPLRAFDPELWLAPDGRLFFFWAQMDRTRRDTEHGVWCIETPTPAAAEPEWSPPRRICDGVMMCKPIVLSSGEWALPVSRWGMEESAEIVVSSDSGKTFTRRGACSVPEDVREFDEHMLVERKDGSLWMLVRTRYGIGESISTDRGMTWPKLTPSSILHTRSRFFIYRLASGNLLLVKHGPLDQPSGRSHLTAYVSQDDGTTWDGGLLLDERSGVSYPDGHQGLDGLIHVVYDHDRRGEREILMATFREDDVTAGRPTSDELQLRKLVSKGSGGVERPKRATPAATRKGSSGEAEPARQASAPPPNVVVIVADDLGYHDVGFHGSTEIPTPHLDALAASGVRCTNGYVSHPFCSPTRAGLLTGRYPHRFGHEHNPAWLPESTTAGLALSENTFPALMKRAGYTTGAVGKWHLGAHPRFHPLKRGFDEYFGVLGGGHFYFPGGMPGREYAIPLDRNGRPEDHTKYLTDHFADEAEAFVGRHASDGRPWMLYLAFNAPHTPLQAPQTWLQKCASISDVHRRTYAAMVAAMDDAIGRLVAKLDSTGQRENTLIFFVSDNGGPDLTQLGNMNVTDNAPLRGVKGMVYEGGIRVPFIVSWPARIQPGVYDEPVIAMDFLPTALAAANAAALVPSNVDGVNLLPYFVGERQGAPHELLFWRTTGPGGNYAVRRGSLKLVHLRDSEPELYDLAADPGESLDLAGEGRQVVEELSAAIRTWEKGTIPPAFDGPKPKRKPKAAAGRAQQSRLKSNTLARTTPSLSLP